MLIFFSLLPPLDDDLAISEMYKLGGHFGENILKRTPVYLKKKRALLVNKATVSVSPKIHVTGWMLTSINSLGA